MSISDKIRESVYKRASNQCEAMMWVDTIWTRCGMRPLEVHHRLKRSQGGGTLDKAGEIYHLVGLCPIHHRFHLGIHHLGRRAWESTHNTTEERLLQLTNEILNVSS